MKPGPADARLPNGIQVWERGWLSSNGIWVDDGAHSTLIDTGYCTHAAQTTALVHAALDARGLSQIVNTHLHSDHCGGNAALQTAYPGVRTLIPPGHLDAVRHWDTEALGYTPTGQSCPRFGFDATLRPGALLRTGRLAWEVHAAPGHDPHSVVLFEPHTKTLLSADALWERGFGVVFPELEGADAFAQVGATLDLIERLAPRVVVPGHGRLFTDVDAALQVARARLARFTADPQQHRMHGIKVLLKFRLLEVQRQPRDAFVAWCGQTPYFEMLRLRHFAPMPLPQWVDNALRELADSGAAGFDDLEVWNVER